MILLILASTATIYMGIFKAHRVEVSFGKKTVATLTSSLISIVSWLLLFSHHYIGW